MDLSWRNKKGYGSIGGSSSHDHELPADIRVDLLEDREVDLILFDDTGERNVEDVDLLLLDEEEE